MEISDKIKEAIIDFLEGTYTQSQADELIAWLNIDKRNSEYLRQITETWHASRRYEKDVSDFRRGMEEVRAKISERDVRKIPSKKIRLSVRSVWTVAATVLVLVTLAFAGLLITNAKNKTVVTGKALVETIVPKGSRTIVTLPDSTTIWLNSDTKFSYYTDYNLDNRTVYLNGEAYFKVSRNEELPFQVVTSEIEITALGTAFNVKAYENECTIETTLEEGQVAISLADPGKKAKSDEQVLLKPKQVAEYKKQTDKITLRMQDDQDTRKEVANVRKPEVRNIPSVIPVKISEVSDTRPYTSWKEKRWVFKNEKISSLAPKLERRFNVTIVILDKDLEGIPFTGTLLDESLEQVLAAIKLAAPIRYEIDSQEVRLSLDKNLVKQYNKYTQ